MYNEPLLYGATLPYGDVPFQFTPHAMPQQFSPWQNFYRYPTFGFMPQFDQFRTFPQFQQQLPQFDQFRSFPQFQQQIPQFQPQFPQVSPWNYSYGQAFPFYNYNFAPPFYGFQRPFIG